MRVETKSLPLLDRNARAALPLRRQLLLYLDPFALFMDASRGPVGVRRRALAYNRAMRWMLVPYMRRWITIAAASLAGIAPAEALAAPASAVPAAALAVGFCIAFTVSCCIAAAYLFLGASGGE